MLAADSQQKNFQAFRDLALTTSALDQLRVWRRDRS